MVSRRSIASARAIAFGLLALCLSHGEPRHAAPARPDFHPATVAAAGLACPRAAEAAAGGWRFPLGLKACALSVGTAIAGLAFVSVAPLGALNAFAAGMLSMLYTCGG